MLSSLTEVSDQTGCKEVISLSTLIILYLEFKLKASSPEMLQDSSTLVGIYCMKSVKTVYCLFTFIITVAAGGSRGQHQRYAPSALLVGAVGPY